MSNIFPAGTRTIRNLEPRYSYFMVVKPATRLLSDLPLKEYFIFKYKVSVSEKRGISDIKVHFPGESIDSIKALNDTEYSTGKFEHPRYKNQVQNPLTFPYKSLMIYEQESIGKIQIQGSIPSIGGNAPLNLAE